MANIEFINGNSIKALEHTLNSIELEESPMYYANAGLIEHLLGNVQSSYEYFKKIFDKKPTFKLPDEYYPVYATSCFKYYKLGHLIPLASLKEILSQATELKFESAPYNIDMNSIYEYLKEINNELESNPI